MNIWPDAFGDAHMQNGTVHECAHLLPETPFCDSTVIQGFSDRLINGGGEGEDVKVWKLTGNGHFSEKLFYNFLIDGGVCCPVS